MYLSMLKFPEVKAMSSLFIRQGRVSINGPLECGEEMLVFCERSKLCTEGTSQVMTFECKQFTYKSERLQVCMNLGMCGEGSPCCELFGRVQRAR